MAVGNYCTCVASDLFAGAFADLVDQARANEYASATVGVAIFHNGRGSGFYGVH